MKDKQGFTLAEVIMSVAVMGIFGGIVYYLLMSGTLLYAKNVKTNVSHNSARFAFDKMSWEVFNASARPVLYNLQSNKPVFASGNLVAATSGPAAGVQYRAVDGTIYKIPSETAASATVFTIHVNGNSRVPEAGDYISIPSMDDFEARIASVGTLSGENITVTLEAAVGNMVNYPGATANKTDPIPADQAFYLVRYSSYVVVGDELRFYRHAVTSTNVNTAFDDANNYNAVIENLETDNAAIASSFDGKPFSYSVSTTQYIDVTLRVSAQEYSNRNYDSFNDFVLFQGSIPHKNDGL